MTEQYDLSSSFQIHHTVSTSRVHIPLELLPKQYIDGKVRVGNMERCHVSYGKRVNKGGHGNITLIQRTPALSGDLCVKTPHKSEYSLCSEAILQWLASQTLKEAGIHGAIPHIYDIFQYAGETRFSMDYIKGVSAAEAVSAAANPDDMWLQILGQVSLLLGYLEEKICLDHRDLKADNIWIRPTPVDYSLMVGGIRWRLKSTFQVVIMDFGFACLGDEEGNAIVSLSDGIVPKIDPCPKEGRDLFQLIASMWSIPIIRARASEAVHEAMKSFMSHRGASFIDLIHRKLHAHWIYLAVSDSAFSHPPLNPASLLLKLNRDWKVVDLQQG
jgi:serine/threonine protein kinase